MSDIIISRRGYSSNKPKTPVLRTQIITTDTAWVVPELLNNQVEVRLFGGGDGGVEGLEWGWSTGSGQGGSMNNDILTLNKGEGVLITIGKGGNYSQSHNTPYKGGTTSFGTYLSANGGGGSGAGAFQYPYDICYSITGYQFGGGGTYGSTQSLAGGSAGIWGGGGGATPSSGSQRIVNGGHGGSYGGGGGAYGGNTYSVLGLGGTSIVSGQYVAGPNGGNGGLIVLNYGNMETRKVAEAGINTMGISSLNTNVRGSGLSGGSNAGGGGGYGGNGGMHAGGGGGYGGNGGSFGGGGGGYGSNAKGGNYGGGGGGYFSSGGDYGGGGGGYGPGAGMGTKAGYAGGGYYDNRSGNYGNGGNGVCILQYYEMMEE